MVQRAQKFAWFPLLDLLVPLKEDANMVGKNGSFYLSSPANAP